MKDKQEHHNPLQCREGRIPDYQMDMVVEDLVEGRADLGAALGLSSEVG